MLSAAPPPQINSPGTERPGMEQFEGLEECATAVAVCPIQHALAVLEGKWTLRILRELFTGPKRTHALLSALPGLSSKTLTQTLRSLEAHDLLLRRVYPEVPPHVEYQLTNKGYELQPVLQALHSVGQRWLQREPCTCSLVSPSEVKMLSSN